MTIKEVSTMFDLTADTLRYYEKMGLLDPVKRTSSGIRDYQESDLRRIRFIKCMRSSGLSIERILKYIDLYRQGPETMIERKDILLTQKERILEQMQDLEKTLDVLLNKIEYYDQVIVQQELGQSVEKEPVLEN